MKQKPHIILFNPDQWRSDVMGHHGNPAAVTPVLDRLVAEEAVSFSNAYSQSTVCTPSRCSFMTGLYPHVRGHRTMFHMLHSDRGETNLLKKLKENGYFVWWGGKNDLTPGQESLDDFCDIKFQPILEDFIRWGYVAQENNHDGDHSWRGPKEGDNYYSFFKGKLDKEGKDLYCDQDWQMILGAIDFIKQYEGDKPLCIYLPIGYPHPPYCVEEPWYSITDRSKIPPRILPPKDYHGKAMMMKGIAEGQNLGKWTEERFTELRATYYGMCSRVDHQFGRLMESLQEKGIYEEAAVFLFSDHGDYTGDYGLVEKSQNTFEDPLVNVPFIIKPPRDILVKPRVNDALVELVDLSATIYQLTGIDPGYAHFGRSLLPLITGETEEHRDAVFSEGGRLKGEEQAMEWESLRKHDPPEKGLYYPRIHLQTVDEKTYHTKAAMCRTKPFKYICRHYEKDELYDLAIDPNEVDNLIDDPMYWEIILEHRERMLQWYMETCDVVPLARDKR